MFKNARYQVLSVVFSISSLIIQADDSNTTRKYISKESYSVYDPMSFITDGSLEIWFKTGNKNAMILYEDTGGQGESIDVFLVDGKARMRLSFSGCDQFKERIINGTFNDRKWHKVKITQNGGDTTFAVDNLSATPVRCMQQVGSMVALYTGCLSWDISSAQGNQWAFPSAYYESMQYGFQGCISEINYITQDKVIIPRLRMTKYTSSHCTNPCNKFRCKHGGKCVDRILTPWCDCQGTGYSGKRCGKALPKKTLHTSPSQTIIITSRPTTVINTPFTKETAAMNARQAGKNHNTSISQEGSLLIVIMAAILSQINLSNTY